MADWETRLKENITIKSPTGAKFKAKWRGNDLTVINKVSSHEFPDVAGGKVQSQGPGAKKWPLTFYFDGVSNDINATDFTKTLEKEYVGKWTIQHPVKGPIFLTWLQYTEEIRPIESGNITVINTDWIDSIPDSDNESLAQLQQQALFQAQVANGIAADQFRDAISQFPPQAFQEFKNSVSKALTTIKKYLALAENFVLLDPQLVAIAAAIESTLDNDIIDTELLAGQIQQYIQLFVLGAVSAIEAINMFTDFAAVIVLDLPLQTSVASKNKVSVVELVATAAVVAASQAALIGEESVSPISGSVTTRAKNVLIADKINNLFNNVTAALDSAQTLFEDEYIDKIYFSQSASYADTLKAVADSSKFLYNTLLSLPAEKRIILREDTCTAQLAKNEYGNIGDDTDEIKNLQILIDSNQLMGDEIYLLNAGKQVLIYRN